MSCCVVVFSTAISLSRGVNTVNLLLASSSDPLIPLIFLGVALTVVGGIALANPRIGVD